MSDPLELSIGTTNLVAAPPGGVQPADTQSPNPLVGIAEQPRRGPNQNGGPYPVMELTAASYGCLISSEGPATSSSAKHRRATEMTNLISRGTSSRWGCGS